MWVNLDEKERALVMEALRSNCTDKPGDENDHDRLYDRLTQFFADHDPADPWRAAAKEQADDELEIDDDAVVSPGSDPGAWVHAWIWISNEDAGIPDPDEEDDLCEECREPLDMAGDGWDGKCADCADKIAAGE